MSRGINSLTVLFSSFFVFVFFFVFYLETQSGFLRLNWPPEWRSSEPAQPRRCSAPDPRPGISPERRVHKRPRRASGTALKLAACAANHCAEVWPSVRCAHAPYFMKCCELRGFTWSWKVLIEKVLRRHVGERRHAPFPHDAFSDIGNVGWCVHLHFGFATVRNTTTKMWKTH